MPEMGNPNFRRSFKEIGAVPIDPEQPFYKSQAEQAPKSWTEGEGFVERHAGIEGSVGVVRSETIRTVDGTGNPKTVWHIAGGVVLDHEAKIEFEAANADDRYIEALADTPDGEA